MELKGKGGGEGQQLGHGVGWGGVGEEDAVPQLYCQWEEAALSLEITLFFFFFCTVSNFNTLKTRAQSARWVILAFP